MLLKLGFAAPPKTLSTGITLPCEMLQAAQQVARIKNKKTTRLQIKVFSEQGGPAQVTGPIQLVSHGSWEDLFLCDWIFVPPLWGNPIPVVEQQNMLVTGLKKAVEQQRTIVATGTGVCLLAQSGVLDQRYATSHWYYLDRFKQRYPNVFLKSGQTITVDQNIYCTAGVNALTDLILHFIRQWFGRDIMNVIERHFSHEVKRSMTQSEFLNAGLIHDDEDIMNAQAWLLEHLTQPFHLNELAALTQLTPRTLSRRFAQATGMSPKQYWQQWRMMGAEELLRDTNLSVQDVADHMGFSDATYFIKLFKKRAFVTPKAYRKISRNKQFQLAPSSG